MLIVLGCAFFLTLEKSVLVHAIATVAHATLDLDVRNRQVCFKNCMVA